MSIHDMALLSKGNMNYSPFEAYIVEQLRARDEADKKNKEKAKKPVTFTVRDILTVFALSPAIALGMAIAYAHLWNYAIDAIRTMH